MFFSAISLIWYINNINIHTKNLNIVGARWVHRSPARPLQYIVRAYVTFLVDAS